MSVHTEHIACGICFECDRALNHLNNCEFHHSHSALLSAERNTVPEHEKNPNKPANPNKPNTIVLRDVDEPNDPITEKAATNTPFQVYGEKVSQDSPLMLIGYNQNEERVFLQFLNVEAGKPGEEPGFGELCNPRKNSQGDPIEGPYQVNVPGVVDFVLYDLPNAKQVKQGKVSKIVYEFSMEFVDV